MNDLKWIIVLVLLVSPFAYAEDYREVSWDDLMPEGWVPEVLQEEEFFGGETAPQMEMAPIVKSLDKKRLKLPGYMIPIRYDASSVSEFLLVPYVGACMHVPPPPENQIVYVSLKEPMETNELWAPVWVSGVMMAKPSTTKFGTAGYQLEDSMIEAYEY